MAYTRIANELLETIILTNLKKRQLKIIMLIIRLSYGCGRSYAVLRQADYKITGIDKSDIKQELEQLAGCGILTITGDRVTINRDCDNWRIAPSQQCGADSFKQILKRNLPGKTVGETPTIANELVGETPTPELVNHQPASWQNTNSGVGKTPTPQTSQANGDMGSESAERKVKDNLNKSKEKEKYKKEKNQSVFDLHFEKFWTAYPRKVEKRRAYRCYKNRITECLAGGLATEDLVRDLANAAANYAEGCRRQDTQLRYIKHPATFLGPDKPYLDWLYPPAAQPGAPPWLTDRLGGQTDEKSKLLESLYLS